MNLSRRLFLGRAGSAAALATAPAAAVVAAPVAPVTLASSLAAALDVARQSENPELIAIGAALPGLMDRHRAAVLAVIEAEKQALAEDGPFPDGLRIAHTHCLLGGLCWGVGERETDILGRVRVDEALGNGKFRPYIVATVAGIDHALERFASVTEGLRKEARRLRRLAVKHEAKRRRILAACGLKEKNEAEYWAGRALAKICTRAASIDATTLAGIFIKAQTISAVETVRDDISRNAARAAASDLHAAVMDVLEPIDPPAPSAARH